MACIGFGFIENLLIGLVLVCAFIAIVRLIIPMFLTPAPAVVQALNIFVTAVVAIFVIIILFDLISCLVGARARP